MGRIYKKINSGRGIELVGVTKVVDSCGYLPLTTAAQDLQQHQYHMTSTDVRVDIIRCNGVRCYKIVHLFRKHEAVEHKSDRLSHHLGTHSLTSTPQTGK